MVLTRRQGEVIVIDEDIFVELLEIQGNRVRLGISAPRGITILRQELLERAAMTIPADLRRGELILEK